LIAGAREHHDAPSARSLGQQLVEDRPGPNLPFRNPERVQGVIVRSHPLDRSNEAVKGRESKPVRAAPFDKLAHLGEPGRCVEEASRCGMWEPFDGGFVTYCAFMPPTMALTSPLMR
jgi:hypothetical protein